MNNKQINKMKACLVLIMLFFCGCVSVEPVVMSNEDVLAIVEEKKRFQNASFEELVLEGRIKKGMSKQQVIQVWGPPKIIRENVINKNYDEEWVYPHWTRSNKLFFRNGVLVGGDPNPEDLI